MSFGLWFTKNMKFGKDSRKKYIDCILVCALGCISTILWEMHNKLLQKWNFLSIAIQNVVFIVALTLLQKIVKFGENYTNDYCIGGSLFAKH